MHQRDGEFRNEANQAAPDFADRVDEDFPTTSAEDVESAGRSCLVILVMAVIILALLLAWVIFGITGGAGA